MSGAFDDLFPKHTFYSAVAKTDKEFRAGRLYRTHVYQPHKKLGFWRPSLEATDTTATHFKQMNADYVGDAFDHPPLHTPMLSAREEYLVLKVKLRPVILIIPPMLEPELERSAYGAPMTHNLCLVAPITSMVKRGDAKYIPEFENNVRALRYAELMFLPEQGGVLQTDSMVRLDECQSVFAKNLEPTEFELSSDVLEVLRSQFLYLFNELDDNYFSTYRKMLAEN